MGSVESGNLEIQVQPDRIYRDNLNHLDLGALESQLYARIKQCFLLSEHQMGNPIKCAKCGDTVIYGRCSKCFREPERSSSETKLLPKEKTEVEKST